ncbi:ATP-binding protein [Nakamurella endophytica]|uniref:ATP-binding protein n=1 Tax=Nakamurella endophytica TaxID=1748367 RepID=UPI001663D0BD|nr:ATP-binding protein [Nakamurella endophytica]
MATPTALAQGVSTGPGGTWAWAVIPPAATDELDSARLVAATAENAADLGRLLPPGADFHIKVQWGRWSGQDYLDQEWRPDLPDGAQQLLALQADRIDANDFPRRQVLIGVRMDVADTSLPAQLTARAKKATTGALSSGDAAQALAVSVKRVSGWLQRMGESSFRARPATTQELAWALRHDLRRVVDWLPDTPIASGGQLARLKSAQVLPGARHTEIGTDLGTRYLRLVIPTETGFPATGLELPGGEWLKHLDVLRSDDDPTAPPVEVSIRGRRPPKAEAVKTLSEALALAKEQERTAREGLAEEAPEQVALARSTLSARLLEVQSGLLDMVWDTPTWVVEAEDLDVLDRRTQALIDRYAGRGIKLWAPPHLQDLLWKETVLGDRRRVLEFAQFRPLSTLVGSWFHGGSQVGSATGSYVAANTGSTPGPVRTRITNAQLTRDAVTTVLVGSTGMAKSTSMCLMLVAEQLAVPSWAALPDMKGDLGGVPDYCEMYGGTVWRLSAEEQASGALDAFRYLQDDPQTAASYAVDDLTLMLPVQRRQLVEAPLRAAADSVAALSDPDQRSTHAIIEALHNSTDPHEQQLGRDLTSLARDPLARAVAGPPDLSATPIPTGPGFVYFKLNALRLPDPHTPEELWKPGGRLSAMFVQAVFTYLAHMSSQVRGIPKLLALPELHLITGFSYGTSLLERIARMGSANDTDLLLDTQATGDLLRIPGLVDQINSVFAFGARTDTEAADQARLLGLEPDRAVLDRQRGLRKGQCLYRDSQGQIAAIRFDRLTQQIAEVLDTTTKRHPTTVDTSTDGTTADPMEEAS